MRINPRVAIVDISHEISAGDITTAAFAIASAYPFFPHQTVHVVVVDPGVGSFRSALVVRTTCGLFVGPNNGVLTLVLDRVGRTNIVEIRKLENHRYFRKPVSSTFHGRDIFASVAAYLTLGTSLRSLGPLTSDLERLNWPEVKSSVKELKGSVVYIDHFGNAITNIERDHLTRLKIRGPQIYVHRRHAPIPVKQFYQQVGYGQPLGIFGSTGFLELCVNGGSAATLLKLNIGCPVRLS